jgi:hypothetical protein
VFFDPLVGAQVAESAVGAVVVVIDAEIFEHRAGRAQVEQQFPIEALVAHPG